MALHQNATKIANLFDPEVIGTAVENKLVDAIKFAPLAAINTELEAVPGSTLTLATYSYIGDAVAVPEGTDIPINQLAQTTVDVQVKKIGNGVQITDEAAMYSYGNPQQEAINQIVLSIASAEDNNVLTTLNGISAPMVHAITGAFSADGVADALEKFGEDMDGAKVILVAPEAYTVLRKANGWIPGTELGAERIINGAVGMIHGCEVVVTNKLKTKKTAFIVKPGALGILLKRGTEVEKDRDIVNKSTILTGDKHSATWLRDASKAVKITFTV